MLLHVTRLAASPVAYEPVLRLQELLFEKRKADTIGDTLLLLEASAPAVACARRLPSRQHRSQPRSTPCRRPCPAQHLPVFTVGKRGKDADFPAGIGAALEAGADVRLVPRGGETTFHGPGQLVAYPIVDLRALRIGARAYVEGLEDAMVQTLGAYGLHARVGAHCSASQRRHRGVVYNGACIAADG